MKRKNQSGFTLLEIIIVIIIIGVLASLALPRLFSTVEFSKSSEALSSISSIRSSLERCYLQSGGSYATCGAFANLDINDPSTSPNAHFTYQFLGVGATAYTIRANRTTFDGGNASSYVQVTQTTNAVTRLGVGDFKGIK